MSAIDNPISCYFCPNAGGSGLSQLAILKSLPVIYISAVYVATNCYHLEDVSPLSLRLNRHFSLLYHLSLPVTMDDSHYWYGYLVSSS